LKDPAKLWITNRRRYQSKSTREISSANKSPEVIEKLLRCHTSTSDTTTPSVLSIVQLLAKQHYYARSRKKYSILSEFQLN